MSEVAEEDLRVKVWHRFERNRQEENRSDWEIGKKVRIEGAEGEERVQSQLSVRQLVRSCGGGRGRLKGEGWLGETEGNMLARS